MKLADIQNILSKITFAPSCINVDWKFEVQQIDNGFLMRTVFQRPDTNTGEIGAGNSRWNHMPDNPSEDHVVKTAYVCIKQVVEHETMESFVYDGHRIFNPHKSILELSYEPSHS